MRSEKAGGSELGRLRFQRGAAWTAALTLVLVVVVCGEVRAQPVPDQWIVMVRAGVDPLLVAARHDIIPRHVYTHALNGFSCRVSSLKITRLKYDPDVVYIEQDLFAYAFSQYLPDGVDRVEADQNPFALIDGYDDPMDVDIAILDTGIDLDHPDLNVHAERSFIYGYPNGDDENGHGTHVAGIAAARDNGFGVVGVCPGARLWALKVLGRSGRSSFDNVIAALDFVTAKADEIEVANLSLGTEGRLYSLRRAIQSCVNAGVVVVVAAGNEARDIYGPDGVFGSWDDTIPACYPEVAAISAIGDSDGKAGGKGGSTSSSYDDAFPYFSNYSEFVVSTNPVTSTGAAIDLAAPGVDVISTWKNGSYAMTGGTSMAAPHVSGAAALLFAALNTRDANGDGSIDRRDVHFIRQSLIDKAQDQNAWRSGSTYDADSNPEGLLYLK
jgi:subtilisin family serine protease